MFTHLENVEKLGETEISGMTKGDQETLYGDCRMQENLLGELAGCPLLKNLTPPLPTVDHSVKQYIDEALHALLEMSGNLVLWEVDTLIMHVVGHGITYSSSSSCCECQQLQPASILTHCPAIMLLMSRASCYTVALEDQESGPIEQQERAAAERAVGSGGAEHRSGRRGRDPALACFVSITCVLKF